jgi:hypothetical protein
MSEEIASGPNRTARLTDEFQAAGLSPYEYRLELDAHHPD